MFDWQSPHPPFHFERDFRVVWQTLAAAAYVASLEVLAYPLPIWYNLQFAIYR